MSTRLKRVYTTDCYQLDIADDEGKLPHFGLLIFQNRSFETVGAAGSQGNRNVVSICQCLAHCQSAGGGTPQTVACTMLDQQKVLT